MRLLAEKLSSSIVGKKRLSKWGNGHIFRKLEATERLSEMVILVVMTMGLFVLAVISGMLRLGIAFAAIPFLSLFVSDLVHQVQPLSLPLNGTTALFSVIGFARSGLVDWKKAILLAGVMTVYAPLGSWPASAGIVKPIYIWFIYLF